MLTKIKIFLKGIKQKRVGGMAHVLEHLPSKCKALNSNSSTVPPQIHKAEYIIMFKIL
jgi:hypothetical protein